MNRMNTRYHSLSKGHKLLVHYISDHYDKAVFLTAANLGKTVGLSESTVVRFAVNLGYKGYPEFQSALEEMVLNKLNSLQRMKVTNGRMSQSKILESVLTSDAEKIKETLTNIDETIFEDVADAITMEGIIEKVAILYATLRRDMRISNPRIAILALNPNDREEHPGKEESDAIIPAVTKLADAGVNAFGPYQASSLFGSGDYFAFDGVLAMYHDQGVAPFKALNPCNNIHYFGGLPLICTSVDMDPCYDIAGKGVADESSLRHAIFMAIDCFRNRNNFDAPMAHPLPKLYHERRDYSEKVRFSIPKKHEGSNKENQ